MASELYNTIDALSREKGIDPQIVVSAVEDAIVVATRKYYKTQENLRAQLDKDTGKIRAFAVQDGGGRLPSRWKIRCCRSRSTTRARSIPTLKSAASCRFRKADRRHSGDALRRNWRSR